MLFEVRRWSFETWCIVVISTMYRGDLYYKKFTDVPFRGKLKGLTNGVLKNGKKNGLWEYYYEDGQLRDKGNYKDGKEDGPWVWYDKNGKVAGISTYKDGIIIK